MSDAEIRYSSADSVARVVIAQPAKLNAISWTMWRSLPAVLRRAEAESSVRVIVVEGEGARAFSAGADISQFSEQRSAGESARAYEAAVAAAMDALANASKPTVAIIRGLAFGGGLALAMCCDLRLSTTDARFRIPAARLGIGYAFAAVEALVERIGLSAAADLLLTARTIDGREAERLKVLSKAWEPASFETEAAACVRAVAANAPLTLRALKAALDECRRPPQERDRVRMDDLVQACMNSADYLEGQAAFREKRTPNFLGS
ncbi:MAG: enoyl-CoA hydratase [Beijerinckiaceae bacterium]